jgi:DNA-binding MarR family transcriptional regulator
VKAGTVERRPCEEDGRGQILAITRAGRALLRRMWPVYARAIQTHLGAKLKHSEASDLDRVLGKLINRN